ncbi:cytochrome P450 9e2-like isoform X2 [Palaemon carinicauda]|uniref:cytochrome P450 9e2-like isoform X2 n=1 Tax=Palaemon carinicauda TaxID=392227 RepID=UPI0035B596AC
MWCVCLFLFVSLLLTLISYSRWRHSYWASKGVPNPPALPFLGHAHKMYNKKIGRWIFENEVYREHGGSTYAGIYEFHNPILLVGDPDLMKYILVKDFSHFTDRRIQSVMTTERDNVMNYMLTSKRGDEWKSLRSAISPAFSSGKMKDMFHLVCAKADALVAFCLAETVKKPFIDMKYNFGRYTVDTLASCAFGIECNSLIDEEAVFPKKVAEFFRVPRSRLFKFLFYRLAPKVFSLLQLRLNPPELDFFRDVVTQTISQRKKSGINRGDFLDLLLDVRSQETIKDRTEQTTDLLEDPDHIGSLAKGLDDNTVVAQCLLFLVAGYDTTASTLAFATFLLAKYPKEQEKLRREIRELVDDGEGKLPYNALMEAKFLDSCLMETLRLYPPGPRLQRMCTKAYKLPGTNLTIPEGSVVQCQVWSVHRDPRYWPEAEEFLPDRFMPENRGNIKSFTHIPFGMGPRNCVGMRFALMEAKVALAKLVLAADLRLAPGCEELVLEGGNTGVLRPKNGVNIILSPLKEE